MNETPDVAIVGGGIIGCSIAYELARRGVAVTVVERGWIGRESSWASAGIISPPSSPDTPEARARLTARSVRAYPEFVAAVEEVSGLDTGFRWRGELTVAGTEEEERELRRLVDFHEQIGFRAEVLDGSDARSAEPILSEIVRGGVFTPEAGNVESYRLTRAVAAAAAHHGATIIEHTPVHDVTVENGRATGLRLPDRTLPAGLVILSAGAWTAEFGVRLGRPLPTLPVKGQMVAIANPPVLPERVIGRVDSSHFVPRTDGSVIFGSTKEKVGFDRRIVAASTQWSLGFAHELGPRLLEGEIASLWAGFRPGTVDEEPIMGRVPGYDNLWAATGHYRTGVQMAVGTAEVMAASILNGTPDPEVEPFSPARFSNHQ